MFKKVRDRLRARLAESGVAGIVLSTSDNVAYLTGYESVLDGWHLPEPISAVFVPTSPDFPVTLFLPEASLIGLVVAAREGQPIAFDRLRTFDLLNFCATGRTEDVHLELAPDLLAELEQFSSQVEEDCAPSIISSVTACLRHLDLTGQSVMFDDMRVALNVEQISGQRYADDLELMLAARSIKTQEEIALFRQSGVKADRVMEFTVGELGRGKSWADIEKAIAHFMIDEDIDPLPTSPMLFGDSYDAIFKPDLFRTHFDTPLSGG